MTQQIISVQALSDYLGADPCNDMAIEQALLAATARVNRIARPDWNNAEQAACANEIIQIMVYLNYYAVRDGTKNTEFLQQHLSCLLTELQLTPKNAEVIQNAI